jgi:hypothetical protein
MADLTRSAKSANAWNEYDLAAYNIEVVDRTVHEFFGISEAELAALPVPLSSIMLEATTIPERPPATKQDIKFFALMEDAQMQNESYVIDFVVFLLGELGYDEPEDGCGHRLIQTRTEMEYYADGQPLISKSDVVVAHRTGTRREYLLVVKEDEVRQHLAVRFEQPLIASCDSASGLAQSLGQS